MNCAVNKGSVILIIVILKSFETLIGQIPLKTDSTIHKLYIELSASPEIGPKYIGCLGELSDQYKKVDSLKQLMGAEAFTNYFNDPHANLKYYAFIELLALDDSVAFSKLIDIGSNADSVYLQTLGQFGEKVKLLELLTKEYLVFIRLKYHDGGGCTYNGRAYLFESRDRQKWREKKATVYKFIETNNLSKEWILTYLL